MNRFSTLVLTAALVFIVGCGGNTGDIGLTGGDRLKVTERLERERFEASYGESIRNITHTNGAFVEIPEGTILEVFVTPRNNAATIEVVPMQVGDVTGLEELRDMFVPERYITHNFLYYSFSLPTEYFGTKLVKVE
jgi:hypothetical protein